MTDDLFAILTASNPEPHHGRPYLWALIGVVLVLLGIAVSVLGPDAPPPVAGNSPTPRPSEEPRVYTVNYRFGVFSPTNLRIHVGDTVRWRNDGNGGVRVTADPLPGSRTPEFDSVGSVQPDGTFAHTFAAAGVYSYRNHGDATEQGTIIVRE